MSLFRPPPEKARLEEERGKAGDDGDDDLGRLFPVGMGFN